jgi:hypothetical protein
MTKDRSNRRLQASVLLLLIGFIAVVSYVNFRSSLLEGTYVGKLNVNEPVIAAGSNGDLQDCYMSCSQSTTIPLDGSNGTCVFKDDLYGNTVWKERKYTTPSQDILDAIEKNYIDQNERTLLIAVANNGMLEYILNWIESLKRSEISKYLVFAIDQDLVDAMTEKDLGDHVVLIPDDWRHVHISGDFAKWKTNDYAPITHAKSLIVERLLYLDVTVWFSDVDIVFTSPHIYNHLMWNMKNRKDVHMLFSQETRQTTINSGFYIMRSTSVTKRVMGLTIDLQDRVPSLTQQGVMNHVLGSMNQDYRTSPMLLLDFMLFPNGNIYFGSKLPTKLGYEPMMVHANYRFVFRVYF